VNAAGIDVRACSYQNRSASVATSPVVDVDLDRPTRNAQAEIDVPERDMGDVCVDQDAELRLRAYLERTFRGRVSAIAPAVTPDDLGFERTVRVDIVIDNSDGLLSPGLSGYARISAGERRDVGRPHSTAPALPNLRVEFWSWW
jgi:multidrug efflux pump subunit AcrA (membrane-fusion protein)